MNEFYWCLKSTDKYFKVFSFLILNMINMDSCKPCQEKLLEILSRANIPHGVLTFTLPSCIACPLVQPFGMLEPNTLPCGLIWVKKEQEQVETLGMWFACSRSGSKREPCCPRLQDYVGPDGETTHWGRTGSWGSDRRLEPRELGKHILVCLIQVYLGHLFMAVYIGLLVLQNRHMALYYKDITF